MSDMVVNIVIKSVWSQLMNYSRSLRQTLQSLNAGSVLSVWTCGALFGVSLSLSHVYSEQHVGFCQVVQIWGVWREVWENERMHTSSPQERCGDDLWLNVMMSVHSKPKHGQHAESIPPPGPEECTSSPIGCLLGDLWSDIDMIISWSRQLDSLMYHNAT